MNSVFLWTYRLILYPLLRVSIEILANFSEKVKRGLKMRIGKYWRVGPPESQPIWIHSASGEFEYAKSVIREIKQRSPETKILVTHFSPSYVRAIENFPGVDIICAAPWDTPSCLKNFILYHRPKALLIARTDLWPEMIFQSQRFKIPTFLFSATLSEKKLNLSQRFKKPIQRWLFSLLDHIYCVSTDDIVQFKKLGIKNVTALGDTRYDQVLFKINEPSLIKKNAKPLGKTIFIAGSTWAEDEAQIVPIIQNLNHINVQTILVPHEPTTHHLREIEDSLKELGLKTTRYSTAHQWPENSVMIVDKLGVLAQLYATATYSFVGGSFKGSVHSVMEPLGLGNQVFVGPYYKNNREAQEFEKLKLDPRESSETMVTVVTDGEDLYQFIKRRQKWKNETRDKIKNAIREEVQNRAGKTEIFVDLVLKRLGAENG